MREWSGAESLPSWGAALRTGAAGSQDESPCRAIHKQHPYRGSVWRGYRGRAWWGYRGDRLFWGHRLPPRRGGCYRGKLEAKRDAGVGLGQVGSSVGDLRGNREICGGIDEPSVSGTDAETVGEPVGDATAVEQHRAILA